MASETKTNFWQILGVLLIVVGAIGMAWKYGYLGGTSPDPAPTTQTR